MSDETNTTPQPTPSDPRLDDSPCSPPKRRRGESVESYQDRVDAWKIDKAAEKTGMKGIKGWRNKRWRVAELERKLSMDEDEIW